MLEKPKRPTKPKIQDRLQPTTVEELIRKYDLENKGVYDFLDKMVDYINDNNKDSITKVGDIFLTTNEENPGIRFGGVWKQIAKGHTLVGMDENDTDFNEIGKTGGSKYLQDHYHTFIHKYNSEGSDTSEAYILNTTWDNGNRIGRDWLDKKNKVKGIKTGDSGNLPPYFVCYIWERIE